MAVLQQSALTLVTTCEDLQDPLPSELAREYHDGGARFEAVGPLLDVAGAHRAAGHRAKHEETVATAGLAVKDGARELTSAEIVAAVRSARLAGRPVVMVSMGTVITGDSTE